MYRGIVASLVIAGLSSLVTSECIHEKYGQFSQDHTGCISVSADADGDQSGVDEAARTVIVDLHNEKRALQGASNMQTMVWDDELALIAQRWSDNCEFAHDAVRRLPGRFSAGQNLAAGYNDWATAINGWYDEVVDFTWGSGSMDLSDVGHYTQVVWAESAKIGCGYTYCNNLSYKRLYACNYGPSGNFDYTRPFIQGTQCDNCPTSCSDNLCDCGGKVCLNGGTLDVNTCECTCLKSWHTGDSCALDCSEVSEPQACGPGEAYDGKCLQFSNVPDECPEACNVCPYADGTATTEANPPTAAATGDAVTVTSTATTANATEEQWGPDDDGDDNGGTGTESTLPLMILGLLFCYP